MNGDLISRAKLFNLLANVWTIEDAYSVIQSMETEEPEHSVQISDPDHIWVDGNQYVSLRRFMEAEAEAKPKKGYWYTIERGEHGYSAGSFRCSVCGEPNRSYNAKPNFCGNCGADMRRR